MNCRPDGKIEKETLHASLPVKKGEKWALTKWVRLQEYTPPDYH
jgi:hypothetical protein